MTPLPKILDVAAIGCGPFNLGLAALASSIPDLELLAFDAATEVHWHRGLMFDDATLQVSFLADLVSLIEPTHALSFLAYLVDVERMYPFYVRERFHITRREYELYLRWVASKLATLRFGHRVESVEYADDVGAYLLAIVGPEGRFQVHARNVVVGIGTAPMLPACLRELDDDRCIHAARYLDRHERLRSVSKSGRITVIGSGQSGAEVVLDLLGRNLEGSSAVSWLTRTPTFAPLDYTKLVLEMTTPEYVRYFHALPERTRDSLVREQWQHYKGISSDTLDQIHDLLYRRELHVGLSDVELRCGVTVEAAERVRSGVRLRCRERDSGRIFEHDTDLVIAATGYRPRSPRFLEPVDALISRDASGRPRVRLDHSIELTRPVEGRLFVSNADLHSHGVAAPDLGICAVRNASILNTVLGCARFRLPTRTAFTRFGSGASAGEANHSRTFPNGPAAGPIEVVS